MARPWTTEHLWHEDKTGSDWHVTLEWLNLAGRLECVGVRLGYSVPPGPMVPPKAVTATATRSLPIGRLIEEGRHEALESALAASVLGEDEPERRSADLIVKARTAPTRREYVVLRAAVAYSRAWTARDSAPVKAVMRELGVRRPTAGKYVNEARSDRFGYLEPTTEGVPNGVLTSKARRLLARFGDDWSAWEQAIEQRGRK